MHESPDQIAERLIQDHGMDEASLAVREGISAAHASGDNYQLSVWREVKQAVQNRQNAATQE